jgi:hypothetical protein
MAQFGLMGRSELKQKHVAALKASQKCAQDERVCCLLSSDVSDICDIFGKIFAMRMID